MTSHATPFMMFKCHVNYLQRPKLDARGLKLSIVLIGDTILFIHKGKILK